MQIRVLREVKNDEKLTPESLTTLILKNRQVKNIEEFLNPVHPLKINISDFGFKKEINKTLKILEKIKKDNEMIVVYTDYDADGITGGAILWETLNLLGFKVMPYVPHRKKEGYGFSKKGIDNVKKLYDPALIISVDHGITAYDKVEYAKSIGIPVIITDHHIKPDKLPEAEAIFHIPELSGSGVAYFFAKELFEHFSSSMKTMDSGRASLARMTLLKEYFSSDYLALASIGTIADLVPLVGASRSVAKYGLASFSKITRVGIKHILKEACIEGRKITPYEVGFIIAPRINAVGRLEHAIDALRLLCTKKSSDASELASKIGQKNTERQDMVKKAVEEAIAKVKGLKKVIILYSENWHEGIIGLIASKLVEKYYRPVIIMTKSDGFLKGSARSIPGVHITDVLRKHKDYLIDVGGHKQAAGFTIEENKLKSFIETLEKSMNKMIKISDLEKIIEADIKMPISQVSMKLVKALEELNPFGIGNRQPVFYSQCEIIAGKLFGKKQEHLRLYVKSNKASSFPLEMIAFSQGDKLLKLSRGQVIDCVYKLEIDRWGGTERVRGRVEYIGV